MCRLLLLLFAVAASAAAAVSVDHDGERVLSRVRRIIGDTDEVGREQKATIFPFSVTITGYYWVKKWKKIGPFSLKYSAKQWVHCGASILSRNHVLTAAHCLQDNHGNFIEPSNWRVYMYGVKRKPGMLHRVKSWFARKASRITGASWARNVAHHAHFRRLFVHPDYDKENILNDIAVVETTSINYEDIAHAGPIDLPPPEVVSASGPPSGQLCSYSGWGCTRPKGGVQERLLMAEFTVVPLRVCTDAYSGANLMEWQDNLCVRANRTTVCPGDSGGGLRCEHNGRAYLAGVASSSATGSNPEVHPANFMRVSAYVDWIRSAMNQRRG